MGVELFLTTLDEVEEAVMVALTATLFLSWRLAAIKRSEQFRLSNSDLIAFLVAASLN